MVTHLSPYRETRDWVRMHQQPPEKIVPQRASEAGKPYRSLRLAPTSAMTPTPRRAAVEPKTQYL